jgi:hypothetical protein
MTISREDKLGRMAESSGTRRAPKVQIHRSTSGPRQGRRTSPDDDKHTADQVLVFEIFDGLHADVRSAERKPDEELVVLLKKEINQSGMTRRDLYAFIGDGPGMLFDSENQAYNLEYGLRKRPTITMECARRWLAIIGKKMVVSFEPADDAEA